MKAATNGRRTRAPGRLRGTGARACGNLGGNATLADHSLAKVFADAEAIFTYEGTYEVNVLIAGRDITGVFAVA